MIFNDTTPVQNRADPLSKIMWQGRQWAVTDYGIECRDGSYVIDAARISECRNCVLGGDDVPLPDWPMHMAEKAWIDINDFCTAFLVALALHPEHAKLNADQIAEGLRRAVKVAGEK